MALVVLCATGAWLATSWLGTYRQAQVVQAEVTTLRGAVTTGDWASVSAGIPKARLAAANLASKTKGTQWELLESFPFVGNTATAVAQLATSLEAVLVAAEPLTPYADRIMRHDVRAADGSFDVTAIEQVSPLIGTLSSAIESSVVRLSTVDSSAVLSEVAGPIQVFRTALTEMSPVVARGADVSRLAPEILGVDGARHWLVLLQNPAEARGSGGFVGGYVVLTADKGRVTMTSSGTSSDLASSEIPKEAAAGDSQLLWGNMLRNWNTYNLTPNFPTTAELSVAGMKDRGTEVSGVIALDPGAVSSLLAATGPVTAAGVTISSENVEQFFNVDIYSQFPDDGQRDKVSIELIRAVFNAFLTKDLDPIGMVDAIRVPASEGRLLAWSSVPDEEERLASSIFGGALPAEPGSTLAVAFNNAAGNKMDAFVQTEVAYSPGRCVTKPVQDSTLSVSVHNDAPADLPATGSYGRLDDPAAPPGSTNLLVHIYAPIGANFLSAKIDGQDASLNLGSEFNRPVWWTYLPLDRGQKRTIDVAFEEPMVLGVTPNVVPQSMRLDEAISVTPNRAC